MISNKSTQNDDSRDPWFLTPLKSEVFYPFSIYFPYPYLI